MGNFFINKGFMHNERYACTVRHPNQEWLTEECARCWCTSRKIDASRNHNFRRVCIYRAAKAFRDVFRRSQDAVTSLNVQILL